MTKDYVSKALPNSRCRPYHQKTFGKDPEDLQVVTLRLVHSHGGVLCAQIANRQLFYFRDRKNTKYMLSPTHEEEITSLVGSIVQSYKDLPIRLYQICGSLSAVNNTVLLTDEIKARKYRDEPRPRQGLLRTREFLMKDLYTFDLTRRQALGTYDEVRNAYAHFFDAFKIPYLVAEADSGSMGGNLSHEYHFLTPKGEDTIISCSNCQYVANQELAQSRETLIRVEEPNLVPRREWSWHHNWQPETNFNSTLEGERIPIDSAELTGIATWTGVTQDRRSLVIAYYPDISAPKESTGAKSGSENTVNLHAIKAIVEQLDTGIENPFEDWVQALVPIFKEGKSVATPPRIVRLFDYRVQKAVHDASSCLPHIPSNIIESLDTLSIKQMQIVDIAADPITFDQLNLLRVKNDDPCPKCSTGRLKAERAVELGHMFFLGSRYSKALQVCVAIDSQPGLDRVSSDTGSETLRSADSDLEHSVEEKGHALLQMGCHGIGISRMIAAVADTLADSKGLNWPRVIAPFEVVIVPSKGLEDAAAEIYDRIVASSSGRRSSMEPGSILRDTRVVDVILDDREKNMGWKLGDADLIGYPVIVVVGQTWKSEQKCEVQCRRLGLRTKVTPDNLADFVDCLLKQL